MSKMRKNVSAYAGPAGDRNDCAVRALAVAAKMPYKEAHDRFAQQGRKDGHGTRVYVSARVLRDAGFKEVSVPWVAAKFPKWLGHMVRPSLAKFARENAGVYVLHTSTHALALVEGVIHDWARGAGSHGKVVRAYKKQ